MPVTGRKPKDESQRRNRVKPVYDWTEVPDVQFEEGPDLPESRPDGVAWSSWTLHWWKVLAGMPHCVLWSGADWQYAMQTAVVADDFHKGNAKAATELRHREKVLGTTVDARRDLRIRYVARAADVEPAESAEVTRLDDYRDL